MSLTLHQIFLHIFILNGTFFKIEKGQNVSVFFKHLVGIFTWMHKAKVNLNAVSFSLSQTERRRGHNISRNSYILLTRQIADGGYVCVCVWAARLVEEVVPLR